jgi:hypothetical protein
MGVSSLVSRFTTSRSLVTSAVLALTGGRKAGPLEQREQSEPAREVVLGATLINHPSGDRLAVRVGLEAEGEGAAGRHGDDLRPAFLTSQRGPTLKSTPKPHSGRRDVGA